MRDDESLVWFIVFGCLRLPNYQKFAAVGVIVSSSLNTINQGEVQSMNFAFVLVQK